MKKGFTVVELLIAFSLISVIAILLFQVINAGSIIYNKNVSETEILIKQSQVAYELNTHFQTKKPIQITSCGNLCINIQYEDSSIDTLKVSKESNTIFLNDNKYILPKNTKISYILSDITSFKASGLDAVLNINIGILDTRFQKDYSINVVYLFDKDLYPSLNTIDFIG